MDSIVDHSIHDCVYALEICGDTYWETCDGKYIRWGVLSLVYLSWIIIGCYYLKEEHDLHPSGQSVEQAHCRISQGVTFGETVHTVEAGVTSSATVIRYFKYGAILGEWVAFTFTPLRLLSQIYDYNEVSTLLSFSFEGIGDMIFIGIAFMSFVSIITLRLQVNRATSSVYMRILYPVIYDLLYIGLITAFSRIALCTDGAEKIQLFGDSTCKCLGLYYAFALIGVFGFLLLYIGALTYKAKVEHLRHAMLFRFQTHFQIMMVLARTVNPLFYALLVELDSNTPSRVNAAVVFITFMFLLMVIFLLRYSYWYQPCVGSGLIANNIRVTSFASSCYLTIIVLGLQLYILLQGKIEDGIRFLPLFLLPMPLVWIVAWFINSRRARLYHVPRIPISKLLLMPSEQVQLVGVIAALHVDKNKVSRTEQARIIANVTAIFADPRSPDYLRIRAARTLWHLRTGAYKKCFIVLTDRTAEDDGLEFGMWRKDMNAERKDMQTMMPLVRRDHLLSKIRPFDRSVVSLTESQEPERRRESDNRRSTINVRNLINLINPTSPSDRKRSSILSAVMPMRVHQDPNEDPSRAASMIPKTSMLPQKESIKSNQDHGIQAQISESIRFCTAADISRIVPISRQMLQRRRSTLFKRETPEALQESNQVLVDAMLDILKSSRVSPEGTFPPARPEAALVLVELYRSEMLRLSKVHFLHIISCLCAYAGKPKIAMDAVFTLHTLATLHAHRIEGRVWKNSLYLVEIVVKALLHPLGRTVTLCAEALTAIIDTCIGEGETEFKSMHCILKYQVLDNVYKAFRLWTGEYNVSVALENLILKLHEFNGEGCLQRERANSTVSKLVSRQASKILSRTKTPYRRWFGRKDSENSSVNASSMLRYLVKMVHERLVLREKVLDLADKMLDYSDAVAGQMETRSIITVTEQASTKADPVSLSSEEEQVRTHIYHALCESGKDKKYDKGAAIKSYLATEFNPEELHQLWIQVAIEHEW